MYANTKHKQSLKSHCVVVGYLTNLLFSQRFSHLQSYDRYLAEATLAAFLHDTGKATSKFQKLFKSKKELEADELQDDKKPYHNEISWAFSVASSLSSKSIAMDRTFWLIYHHHKPRPVYKDSVSSFTPLDAIYDSCSEKDRTNIIKLTQELLGLYNKAMPSHAVSMAESLSIQSINAPKIDHYVPEPGDPYKESDGIEKLCQSALVVADRWVSAHLTAEECDEIAGLDMVSGQAILAFHPLSIRPKSINLNHSRSENENAQDLSQWNLAIEASSSVVSLVSASPAFGKTSIMLKWLASLSSKQEVGQLLVVLPTNSTAENVYIGILSELKRIGISGLSAELFLSGTIQESTTENQEIGMLSDIVVTNIDSIATPLMKHASLGRILDIASKSTIIAFDEFHELVQENCVPSLFSMLITARCANSAPTLLLSATPVDISVAIPCLKQKGIMIETAPTKPVRDNDVTIFFSKSVEEGMQHKVGRSAVICATIDESQSLHEIHEGSGLVHAGYTIDDRKSLVSDILSKYGKNGIDGEDVSYCTALVQSSLDVSWNTIIDVTQSPDKTIQILGRLNRFNLDPGVFVVVDDPENDTYDFMQGKMYTKSLAFKWVNFLKARFTDGSTCKKSDIYQARLDFMTSNKKEVESFIKQRFSSSFESFHKIGFLGGSSQKKSDEHINPNMKKNIRESNSYYVLMNHKVDGQWAGLKLITVDKNKLNSLFKTIREGAKSYCDQANFLLGEVHDGQVTHKLEKRHIDAQLIMKNAKKAQQPLISRIDGIDYLYYDSKTGKRGLGIVKSN